MIGMIFAFGHASSLLIQKIRYLEIQICLLGLSSEMNFQLSTEELFLSNDMIGVRQMYFCALNGGTSRQINERETSIEEDIRNFFFSSCYFEQ